MLRPIVAFFGLALASIQGLQAAPQQSSPQPSPAAAQRALLNRYCVTCHNEKLKTADLMLGKISQQQKSRVLPLLVRLLG